MPRSLEMNLSASNFSKSSGVSPTPIKAIGAFVSETADRAPPPFAVPSSFVMITPVIPTESLKHGPAGLPAVRYLHPAP